MRDFYAVTIGPDALYIGTYADCLQYVMAKGIRARATITFFGQAEEILLQA